MSRGSRYMTARRRTDLATWAIGLFLSVTRWRYGLGSRCFAGRVRMLFCCAGWVLAGLSIGGGTLEYRCPKARTYANVRIYRIVLHNGFPRVETTDQRCGRKYMADKPCYLGDRPYFLSVTRWRCGGAVDILPGAHGRFFAVWAGYWRGLLVGGGALKCRGPKARTYANVRIYRIVLYYSFPRRWRLPIETADGLLCLGDQLF